VPNFKYALVWGSSVKHSPQKVGKEHVRFDEDDHGAARQEGVTRGVLCRSAVCCA
jgi:hypothetical protein